MKYVLTFQYGFTYEAYVFISPKFDIDISVGLDSILCILQYIYYLLSQIAPWAMLKIQWKSLPTKTV